MANQVVDLLDVGLSASQGSKVEEPELPLELNAPSRHSFAKPPRSTLEAPGRLAS